MKLQDLITLIRQGRYNKSTLCRAAGIAPSNSGTTLATLLSQAERLNDALSGVGLELHALSPVPMPEGGPADEEQRILLEAYWRLGRYIEELENIRDVDLFTDDAEYKSRLSPAGEMLHDDLMQLWDWLRDNPKFWEPPLPDPAEENA